MNKYPQEPHEIIDLHGYTTGEAGDILRQLYGRGAKMHVRIIVGKGLRSANGPVLPDFVKNFLTAHNIRFSQSKIEDGGEGALEVYL